MSRPSLIQIFVMMIPLLPATPGWSQTTRYNEEDSCIQQALSRIRKGKWVRVFTVDSLNIEGELAGSNVGELILLPTSTSDTAAPRTIPAVMIDQIQYRETGKIRPEFGALGMIAGGFIGWAIALDVIDALDRPSWDDAANRRTGMAIGGAVGCGAGLVIGLTWPSQHVIKCR